MYMDTPFTHILRSVTKGANEREKQMTCDQSKLWKDGMDQEQECNKKIRDACVLEAGGLKRTFAHAVE